MLDDSMFGGMMNEIQSYDYLDNDKYMKIQKLLKIMQETFGYDEFMQDGYKASMAATKPDGGNETAGEMDNRSRETGREQDGVEMQSLAGAEIQLVNNGSSFHSAAQSKINLQ